ncbi:hypothetical protein Gogos_006150 [Gossypium gossypioides]|uniref:Retrovirus-related Pol polyprotein from transposon TNT 1-94 n=1 Tax=Gossypium gossypioides TaxID=34282 RepID=A0A7J9C4X9_GOSGO|nr:hypothetical protein [Gossypium gossypioides]
MIKSLVNSLVLKQHLYTFRMGEYNSIRAHISEFDSLLNDLKNVEVQIDDEDQDMLLLYSFPPSYKSFRETQIYGRDKLSFEEVNRNLLSKGKLDNEFGSSSSSSWKPSAFVARSRTDSRSRNRDQTCNYYKKKGHIKVRLLDMPPKRVNVRASAQDLFICVCFMLLGNPRIKIRKLRLWFVVMNRIIKESSRKLERIRIRVRSESVMKNRAEKYDKEEQVEEGEEKEPAKRAAIEKPIEEVEVKEEEE